MITNTCRIGVVPATSVRNGGRGRTPLMRTTALTTRPIARTNATIRVRTFTRLAPVLLQGFGKNGENPRNDGIPRILPNTFPSGPTHGKSETLVSAEKPQ